MSKKRPSFRSDAFIISVTHTFFFDMSYFDFIQSLMKAQGFIKAFFSDGAGWHLWSCAVKVIVELRENRQPWTGDYSPALCIYTGDRIRTASVTTCSE